MSEELLPCPFCGSPARRIKAEDSSWIGCQRCSGSNTNPFKDIAEREWNTRVESAELAQLREKLAAAEKLLREAIEPGVFGIQDRSRISAPEDEMIRKLGLQIGFGALMDSASRMWAIVAEQDGHPGSEFIVSACAATQKRWVAQVEELLAIIDGNDVLKEGM